MKAGESESMVRICEAIESAGPIAPRDVARLTNIRGNKVRTYLGRAAGRGILVCCAGGLYAAAPDWRALYAATPKPIPPKPRVRQLPPNSVFQFAERIGAQA